MPLPLKMKTTMSVLVVSTMTLFMTASFFFYENLLASGEAEGAAGYLPYGKHFQKVITTFVFQLFHRKLVMLISQLKQRG